MKRKIWIICSDIQGTLLPLLQWARQHGFRDEDLAVLSGEQMHSLLQNSPWLSLWPSFPRGLFQSLCPGKPFGVAGWMERVMVLAYAKCLQSMFDGTRPDVILTDAFQIHVPVLAHRLGIPCLVLGPLAPFFPLDLASPWLSHEQQDDLNDQFALLNLALSAVQPLLQQPLCSYPRLPLFGDLYGLRWPLEILPSPSVPEPFTLAGDCLPSEQLVETLLGPQKPLWDGEPSDRLIFFEDHKHLPEQARTDLVDYVRKRDLRMAFLSRHPILEQAAIQEPNRFQGTSAYPYRDLKAARMIVSGGHPTAVLQGLRSRRPHLVLSTGSGTHFNGALLQNYRKGRMMFASQWDRDSFWMLLDVVGP